MFISLIDSSGNLTGVLENVASDVTSEQAATALGWSDGTWQEVADEEATLIMQKPSIMDQIQAIQSQYQESLNTLMSAYTAALITGDTADATAIQSEYNAMLNQMASDISAVTG
jgi:hypothetical protein